MNKAWQRQLEGSWASTRVAARLRPCCRLLAVGGIVMTAGVNCGQLEGPVDVTSAVVVTGHVTAEVTGKPVTGVTVNVTVFLDAGEDRQRGVTGWDTTDEEGNYRAVAVGFGWPFRGRVRARFLPEASTGLDSATVHGPVIFVGTRDSAIVNASLPARPPAR